jgi:hypothetical protein
MDPAIIAASIAALVSLLALGVSARQWSADRARAREDEAATVDVARIGDDATIRAQLHEWLESERRGHQGCLEEVQAVRLEFIRFRAEHPDCQVQIARLRDRVETLEGELGHAAE